MEFGTQKKIEVTDKQISTILSLHDKGFTNTNIAKRTGISRYYVEKVIYAGIMNDEYRKELAERIEARIKARKEAVAKEPCIWNTPWTDIPVKNKETFDFFHAPAYGNR